MTCHVLEARVLGMLGIAKFWQEMYGTFVYFFQYFNNRRFERAPRAHMWGIVVPANGIWILFPAVGMWACSRLILDGSFTVFGWQPEIPAEIPVEVVVAGRKAFALAKSLWEAWTSPA